MKLTVKKVFEDDLTAGEDRQTEVKLILQRRDSHQTTPGEFEPYEIYLDGKKTSEIVLNEGNNWTREFYVAPGFEVDGEVLEHGYDFTITEPGIDYHYGLIEEIINPMVVNGKDKYYGDGVLIDDGSEEVEKYVDQSLTAVNRVKSGIDVRKVLVDAKGNEIVSDETEFTIKGKLLDPDGNPYTFNTSWDDRTDKRPPKQGGDAGSDEWQLHQNDPGAYHKFDKDGNQILYKGHFASTDAIEFTLKAGEYVRFINVPDGCTFEFEEVISAAQTADGYAWDSTEAKTQHRTEAGGPFTPEGDVQPDVDNTTGKVTLTGEKTVVGNKQYSIVFTNKTEKGESFYIYHSSDNSIEKVFANDARIKSATYDADAKSYTYTFNIVDETKAGYLYGGYFMNTTKTVRGKEVTYKGYLGTEATDDEIIKLDYAEKSGKTDLTYVAAGHEGGYWASDAKGSPYTGEKASQWANSSVQTTKGTAMNAVANGVYYLKEVPEQYFRPALYYVYDERTENKDVKKLYLLVPVDDGIYQFVNGKPIELTNGTSLYSIFKVTDFFGNEKSLTVVDANENLKRGFLVVWDRADLISAASYEWTPNFTTKDGVLVTAIAKRTFGFDSGLGFQYLHDNCNDVRVASTYA